MADSGTGRSGRPNGGRPSWRVILAIVLAVALLVLFMILHLSGALGPGMHG